MNHLEQLIDQLESRKAIVCVVGLGYVGLPLALRCLNAGFKVLGLDIDQDKCDQLNSGEALLGVDLSSFTERGKFYATTDPDLAVIGSQVVVICVPTPLGKHCEPNLLPLRAAVYSVVPNLRAGSLVVLESTVYPGVTRELLVEALDKNTDLTTASDVFVGYSPEREDPGRTMPDTPKVVAGYRSPSRRAAQIFYESIGRKVHLVSRLETAELTKLLENTYRAVNVSLVNEMKVVADALGVDIWEVVRAAATKPFGFAPFYPGPGMGGHCIPVDPFYLAWKAKDLGVEARFVELAGTVNREMPFRVAGIVANSLNRRKKPVCGSNILVLGVAYKPGVGDTRESPAYPILRSLWSSGANLLYCDPHVPRLDLGENRLMEAKDLTTERIRWADCVLLLTDHVEFDYGLVEKLAILIVDTRGRFGRRLSGRVVRA